MRSKGKYPGSFGSAARSSRGRSSPIPSAPAGRRSPLPRHPHRPASRRADRPPCRALLSGGGRPPRPRPDPADDRDCCELEAVRDPREGPVRQPFEATERSAVEPRLLRRLQPLVGTGSKRTSPRSTISGAHGRSGRPSRPPSVRAPGPAGNWGCWEISATPSDLLRNQVDYEDRVGARPPAAQKAVGIAERILRSSPRSKPSPTGRLRARVRRRGTSSPRGRSSLRGRRSSRGSSPG